MSTKNPHRSPRRRTPRILCALVVTGVALGGCASLRGDDDATSPGPGYVFGWPDFPHETLELRGGTSLGAPVVLRTEPSAGWAALQAAGPGARDRDRAAIRALAGGYRVSFDFLETIVFDADLLPDQPYRSWGTEMVFVLEDRPDFVSLQHVMVMYALDDEGEVVGPFVQKHWRQDWRYEPERVHVYDGFGRWSWREVPAAERAGAWSQTVYQVDDAPRYTLVGRWRHEPGFSSWTSGDGWRPLPRRESTVRDDYQVLAGPNRITVLPTGWVHEQDNLKRVLDAPGERDAPVRARAREIGLARYELLDGFDFSAGEAYWERTRDAWAAVREGWRARIEASPTHTIADACDGTPVFATLFTITDPEAMEAAHAHTDPDAAPEELDFDSALAGVLDCAVAPADDPLDRTNARGGSTAEY